MFRSRFSLIPMILLAAEQAQGAAASTEPAKPAEEKLTIAQKVEALQARKTLATQEMNAAPEGAGKTALAEEIAVIDRKLRWYAGRSGEAKPAKAPKASRPKAAKSSKGASAPAAETPAPAASAANES